MIEEISNPKDHPAIEKFYEYIDRGGWGSSSMNRHLAACLECELVLEALFVLAAEDMAEELPGDGCVPLEGRFYQA